MGYIENIRKKVGKDPIFMPATGCGIIKDNKILLQKRTDNNKWAIHGGSLELGETFLDCVKREVREELGIDIVDPVFIGTYSGEDMHYFYPNKDEVYIVSAVYLVTKYNGVINIDYNEVKEVKWFDIDSLPENIHDPDKKSVVDIINYYKVHNNGKMDM